MAEPKYIKTLTKLYHGMDKKLAVMATSMGALPKMEQHLKELNTKVQSHDVSIARLQERQDDPVAGNPDGEDEQSGIFSLAKWGLKQFGVFGVMALIIVLLIVLRLAESGFFALFTGGG